MADADDEDAHQPAALPPLSTSDPSQISLKALPFKDQRPANREDFEIAILYALTLEADAVGAMFNEDWDDWEEVTGTPYDKTRGDPNAHSTGRIGRHDVGVVRMAGMGKANAAAVAGHIRASWPNLKLALVVGICGAYDLGRQLPERFVLKDTLQESLGRPRREIRTLLDKLQTISSQDSLRQKLVKNLWLIQEDSRLRAAYPGAMHDVLFEAKFRHLEDGRTCDKAGCNGPLVQRDRLAGQRGSSSPLPPDVHFGLVASGDKVMKSGRERDRITREQGVIAFEMESAGVWDELSCIVIKGVCDYANSHKSKAWQHYAAATAAACAAAFPQFWVP